MMRQDIQCLRGFAIISVVVFHIFPEVFINGFLGVDMFFVISGFLMSQILQDISLCTIPQFYYRRIRRIVPVYYLVILAATFLKICFQADVWWRNNDIYSKYSIEFRTNQKIIDDHSNYFEQFHVDMTTSRNLFLHCWSLCVEVQFYIIAPFLFFGLGLIPNLEIRKIVVVVIMGMSYSMIWIYDDAIFLFNIMPARIWQFAVGIFVQLCSNREEKDPQCSSLLFSQLAIVLRSQILFVFLPITLNENITRPIITLATGWIIFENNKFEFPKWLGYIGDASYVIYLVHWPIIVLFSPVISTCFSIYLIITVSVPIHHIFEKIIIRRGIWTTLIITCLLLSLNIGLHMALQRFPPHKSYPLEHKPRISKMFENNQGLWRWPNCTLVPIPEYPGGFNVNFGRCRFKNGNGTKKVVVLGNSYALNQMNSIHDAFQNNYSVFEYVTMIASFGIYHNGKDESELKLNISRRLVEEIRPDILFIVTRVCSEEYQQISNYEEDDVILQYNDNIKFYEKFVKKIYILGAFPRIPMNFMNRFIENLQMDIGKFEDFRFAKDVIRHQTRFSRDRFNHIQCKKCQVYDLMSSVFLENDYYYGYNTTTFLTYFDNDMHLTNTGLEKIRPFYQILVKNENITIS